MSSTVVPGRKGHVGALGAGRDGKQGAALPVPNLHALPGFMHAAENAIVDGTCAVPDRPRVVVWDSAR